MEPRDLSEHVAYEAGRGVEEVARELGVDPDDLVTLSSNENALGPSPAAIEAIRDGASGVHEYPKAAHVDLRVALAERWNVAPAQVWLSAGGDGAIDCLSRAMLEPGDRALVPTPGFAYYGMSARYHHGGVTEYALDEADDFELAADVVLSTYDGERIVYVTSPHNPTGAEMTVDGIELVAEETSEDTLVVIDEAYGEFSDRESATTLLADRDDVAVVRTFSKAYGLAGLRLGYALVPGDWADAYARVNTPFAAGELACRTGLAALDDDEHVEESVHLARWARSFMQDAISAPTCESGGNFVLVDVAGADVDDALDSDGETAPDGDAAGTASAVARELRERGVIVRDCTSFGLPDHVRVTCGTEHETRRAVEAINEVVAP